MIKFLTEHRYSFFDSMGQALVLYLMMTHETWLWGLLFFPIGFISLLLEAYQRLQNNS